MQSETRDCKNNKYASTTGIKRTLNLTSLTVNAMALIAPGRFSLDYLPVAIPPNERSGVHGR